MQKLSTAAAVTAAEKLKNFVNLLFLPIIKIKKIYWNPNF
jgi:hypothetical protein